MATPAECALSGKRQMRRPVCTSPLHTKQCVLGSLLFALALRYRTLQCMSKHMSRAMGSICFEFPAGEAQRHHFNCLNVNTADYRCAGPDILSVDFTQTDGISHSTKIPSTRTVCLEKAWSSRLSLSLYKQPDRVLACRTRLSRPSVKTTRHVLIGKMLLPFTKMAVKFWTSGMEKTLRSMIMSRRLLAALNNI